jgi:hypothetical protein
MRIERALVGLLFIATAAAGGCGKLAYNLPPASRLMEPGPGVGGPGPGVIPPAGSPYGMYGGGVNRFGGGMSAGMGGACGPMGPGGPGGSCEANFQAHQAHRDVMPASFNAPCGGPGGSCPCGPGGPGMDGCMQAGFMHGHSRCGPGSTEAYADGSGLGAGAGMPTSQIAFLGDNGVQVSWDVSGAGTFDSTPLVIPGRQDFYQGAIYRLRLSNIPGRPGIQLYPTLEVAPVTPRTDAYLAHAPIPVQFTEEDFDQVVSGNFVTKVIYLPDPEFQELALAGVETLVSTRLDPGVDPIAEADRRGSILAIVRIGSKDLQLGSGTPGQSGTIVPANHEEPVTDSWRAALRQQPQGINQVADEQPADIQTDNNDMAPGEYRTGGPGFDSGAPCMNGGSYGNGAPCRNAGTNGNGYGNGSMGSMPMGMPTSGFAPQPVPPNMLAGGPQWGMPITGTPIGLPGPPHVPLGIPAGLQKHVIKNRTKVVIPPAVTKMEMSVKERPGHNYPRPVDHVHVDEAQREPFRLFPAWMTGALHHGGGGGNGGFGGSNCEPYPQ